MIEWCFTPLLTVFQSYHGDSSNYSCISWVSPGLGWGSEVSCPRTLPRKNPEDPVRLERRPLDYESKTLPLSHAGPRHCVYKKIFNDVGRIHNCRTLSLLWAKRQNFRSTQFEGIYRRQFQSGSNDAFFSYMVENIVGKGEISDC